MNPELLKNIVKELKDGITGGIISSIHQTDKRQIILRLFVRGRKMDLLISTHPRFSRIHLIGSRLKNPRKPLKFCTYLRAHIGGSCISDINQVEGERIGHISLKKRTDDTIKDFTLIFELTGKSSNIILLDDKSMILDAMRHFPPEEGCPRPVMPNIPFTPLPPGGKKEECEISKDNFATWNEAADAFYSALAERERFEKEKNRLRRIIRYSERHLERKLKNLHRDRERAEANIEGYRIGELLLANFSKLKRGIKEIEVEDFHNRDRSRVVKIALDESIGPEENIERYFKKARKGKTALEILKDRIPQTEKELEYVKKVLNEGLESAKGMEELQRISHRLSKTGYLKSEEGEEKKVGRSEPIRRFTTPEGFEILCGKNDYGNELLLKRYARGSDLWFHASGVSGSHVLLMVRDTRTVLM